MKETEQQPSKARRRRGATLEAVLLQAAWDELTAVGYATLTMEGVAARAKTSKMVLYRRWPNRPELMLAALRHRAKTSSAKVPDTGSLRGDVLALLRDRSERYSELAGLISILFTDYYRETGLPPSVLRERIRGGSGTMELLLRRAVERGEISAEVLSSRIARLPTDLVRHDLIMTQGPLPDASLVEIVDEIFLPLLRGWEP
jgi:AcrR family transcriptional regulator